MSCLPVRLVPGIARSLLLPSCVKARGALDGAASAQSQRKTTARSSAELHPPRAPGEQERKRHQNRRVKRFRWPQRNIRRTLNYAVTNQDGLAPATQRRFVQKVFSEVVRPRETGGEDVIDAVCDRGDMVRAGLLNHSAGNRGALRNRRRKEPYKNHSCKPLRRCNSSRNSRRGCGGGRHLKLAGGRHGQTFARVSCQRPEATGREPDQTCEAANKSPKAVVAHVKTYIGDAGVGCEQKPFGRLQSQGVEKLVRWNAGDVAKYSIEMIRADVRYSGHLLQRERLVQTVMHYANDSRDGLVMRGRRGGLHVLHLAESPAENFGSVVNAERIHKSSSRVKLRIRLQSFTKFVGHGYRNHSFAFALHAGHLLFAPRDEFF